MRIYFQLSWAEKGAELSTERINYYAVAICTKQSGLTVKNVEHSKNDSLECSKQVPKDWHSGDFDKKWQEKELYK